MSLVSTEWLDNNHSKVKIIDSSWHMPNTNRNAYEEYKKEHIKNATFFDIDKFKKIGGINFQNSSAAMAYLLYGSGYDTPGFTAASGKSNNTGLSKAHLNTMLQNLTIQQLAFTPDATINIGGVTSGGKISAIEQWTLKNPIIKSISWGSLAYGEDGLIEYTIDIDYDYAEVSYNKTTVGFRITE